MTQTPGSPYRFRAFLSYSHKDRRTAEWLHQALEAYRIPRQLVGKRTSFGPVPPRVGRIFRDEEELKGSPDLSAPIREALQESESLVVLCSSHAAGSHWIDQEIREFQGLGREDRIVAVIAGGVPNDPQRECFPPALKSKLGPDGEPAGKLAEPLAINLNKLGRRRALAKVLASLTGLQYDDLWRREWRRLWRRRIVATAIVLSVLAGTTGVLFYAQDSRSVDGLMELSSAAVRAKRWDLAAMAAAAALPSRRPAVADLSQPIRRLRWLRGAGRTEKLMLGHKKSVAQALEVEGTGELLTASLDTTVRSWRRTEPESGIEVVNTVAQLKRLSLSPDGQRLLIASDWRVAVFDLRTRRWLLDWTSPQADTMIKAAALARGGLAIVVVTSRGELIELSGQAYGSRSSLFRRTSSLDTLAISPSGSRVAFGSADGFVGIYDLPSRKLLFAKQADQSSVNHVTFGSSDAVIVSSASDASVFSLRDGAEPLREWFTLRDLTILYSEIAPVGRIALSVMSPGSVAVWATETGDVVAELTVAGCQPDEPFNQACQATLARFVPTPPGERERVVVGYRDGAIRLWSAEGKLLGELMGHVGPITDLRFAREGSRLLSASEDHTARLWHLGDTTGLDGRGRTLKSRFCSETDPLLLRLDSSHDWDIGLRFTIDHDPAALRALVKEIESLDACASGSIAARGGGAARIEEPSSSLSIWN